MTVTDPLLEGLNPEQQKAVAHAGSPLLVVAGAGSGKTRVLTRRIAYIMARRDVRPYEILAITFTNKAAAEMRERVKDLLGEAADGMWLKTFHSACVLILRREAERQQAVPDPDAAGRQVGGTGIVLGDTGEHLLPGPVHRHQGPHVANIEVLSVRVQPVGLEMPSLDGISVPHGRSVYNAAASCFSRFRGPGFDYGRRHDPNIVDGLFLLDHEEKTSRGQKGTGNAEHEQEGARHMVGCVGRHQ